MDQDLGGPAASENGSRPEGDGPVALAVGPVVALGVAGLLASVRDDFGTTNVALVLAGVVVVAALAGRIAGFATAITAAAAFNFFHTLPYRSLRISAGRDVVTVVLLLAIGIIVSEIGAWRRRAQTMANRRLQGERALEKTSGMLAAGADPEEIWQSIRALLVESFGLADCRFEAGTTASVDPLPRSGSLVSSRMQFGLYGFDLPPGGVSIAVTFAGTTFGHIVLVPGRHTGTSIESRQIAIALADQFAIAKALAHRDSPERRVDG